MRCSRFLTANTAASVMWAVACSFGAYALGSASTRVGTALMTGGLAAVGLLTIVVALVIGSQGRRCRDAVRFPRPPFNPYVRFSRIRLTDGLLDMVTLPLGIGWCP